MATELEQYVRNNRVKWMTNYEVKLMNASVQAIGDAEFNAFFPMALLPPTNWDFALDLSRWNIPVSWEGIKQFMTADRKISRAIIKSSEGTWSGYPITEYWDWVDRAHFPIAPYHFYLKSTKAKDQAAWFLKRAIKSTVSPWLDIEDVNIPATLTPWYKNYYMTEFDTFCKMVEDAWGVPVCIYTGAWYWTPRFKDTVNLLKNRPLAVAHYKSYQDWSPLLPVGWTTWEYWQYTSTASVPGCSTNVDLSVRKIG